MDIFKGNTTNSIFRSTFFGMRRALHFMEENSHLCRRTAALSVFKVHDLYERNLNCFPLQEFRRGPFVCFFFKTATPHSLLVSCNEFFSISWIRLMTCGKGLSCFRRSLLIDCKWFSNGKAENAPRGPKFNTSSAK